MRAIKGVIDAKGDSSGRRTGGQAKKLEPAFVKLFPAGSDKGDTKALPAVWTDMAGLPGRQQERRCRLRQARRRGGFGRYRGRHRGFRATGKACGACHEKFRAKAN